MIDGCNRASSPVEADISLFSYNLERNKDMHVFQKGHVNKNVCQTVGLQISIFKNQLNPFLVTHLRMYNVENVIYCTAVHAC